MANKSLKSIKRNIPGSFECICPDLFENSGNQCVVIDDDAYPYDDSASPSSSSKFYDYSSSSTSTTSTTISTTTSTTTTATTIYDAFEPSTSIPAVFETISSTLSSTTSTTEPLIEIEDESVTVNDDDIEDRGDGEDEDGVDMAGFFSENLGPFSKRSQIEKSACNTGEKIDLPNESPSL